MVTYGKDGEMWRDFCTWENFDKAQKRSRLHKGKRYSVRRFEKNRDENLREIMRMCVNGEYHCSPYTTKTIYEPKERLIYILPYAPDRIVQHAVMNILIPYYMRMFYADSYSCIEGRGQMLAARKTMALVRRFKYCYELDIHHCFPSINLQLLSDMHHNKFRDKTFLELNDRIIFSVDGDTNCPIGNFSSQWYMNFYLTLLDNFNMHKVRLPHIRFCDNVNSYANDIGEMHRAEDMQGEFLLKVLKMTTSKSNIKRTEDGIDFVGYRCFPDGKILVRKRTAQKHKRDLKTLVTLRENGLITKEQMRSSVDSMLGWWKHAKTHHLVESTGILRIREKYCA